MELTMATSVPKPRTWLACTLSPLASTSNCNNKWYVSFGQPAEHAVHAGGHGELSQEHHGADDGHISTQASHLACLYVVTLASTSTVTTNGMLVLANQLNTLSMQVDMENCQEHHGADEATSVKPALGLPALSPLASTSNCNNKWYVSFGQPAEHAVHAGGHGELSQEHHGADDGHISTQASHLACLYVVTTCIHFELFGQPAEHAVHAGGHGELSQEHHGADDGHISTQASHLACLYVVTTCIHFELFGQPAEHAVHAGGHGELSQEHHGADDGHISTQASHLACLYVVTTCIHFELFGQPAEHAVHAGGHGELSQEHHGADDGHISTQASHLACLYVVTTCIHFELFGQPAEHAVHAGGHGELSQEHHGADDGHISTQASHLACLYVVTTCIHFELFGQPAEHAVHAGGHGELSQEHHGADDGHISTQASHLACLYVVTTCIHFELWTRGTEPGMELTTATSISKHMSQPYKWQAPSETYDSRRREVASAVTAIASHLRLLLRNQQLSTRLVTVLFGDFAYCYCQYIIVYRVVCVTGKCLGYSFVMENVGNAATSRMSECSGFPSSAATADRHAYFRFRQLVMIFKTRKYNKATHSTDTSARKYKNAAHQLNGWRDSVVTLSTSPLDFDLCLRIGRGLR
ncbi:hypothetical protein J6590_056144 [Homalodisca vitripennis]|nr:hypothetical protein J6590_056144 [Homalodisca vitripennis]